MPATFDRKVFYDMVRDAPFDGRLSQGQVDGMEFILDCWERTRPDNDLRWLAYPLATTFLETASTCQPIEEYGKGKGKPYGQPHAKTGEIYYGRGYCQLTWYENYLTMTGKLRDLDQTGKDIDLVVHPDQALIPLAAAAIMFVGMEEGLFRRGHTLERYFNFDDDDPFEAREIINGDKNRVPKWSNGVSIGQLVAGYYADFLEALQAAQVVEAEEPVLPEPGFQVVQVDISTPVGVSVAITVNGQVIMAGPG